MGSPRRDYGDPIDFVLRRGPSDDADWLFGVYDGTPVQPWIAALFIADTGAAT